MPSGRRLIGGSATGHIYLWGGGLASPFEGAARSIGAYRSSKPAGRSSPPLGWFDSIAAPWRKPCAARPSARPRRAAPIAPYSRRTCRYRDVRRLLTIARRSHGSSGWGGAIGGSSVGERMRGSPDSARARTLYKLSVRPEWPEGPLLEGRAPPFLVEADDPDVAVGLRGRLPVADLQANHSGVGLDRD